MLSKGELANQYKHPARNDGPLSCAVDTGWRAYRARDEANRTGAYVSSRYRKVRMIEKVVGTGSEFESGPLSYRNSFGELTGDSKESRTAQAVGPYVTEVRLLIFRGELWRGKARRSNGGTRAAFAHDAPIEEISQNSASERRGQIAWYLAVCN